MKKDVEINEENVIRTITTYPKEKFVGHWKSGRLYPLYNVVENNGSMFLSLNGKMKEEPYVSYNGETNVFSANEGWAIKEMSADSKLTAMSDTADIQEITALINAAVAPLQEEIDELKSQIRYSTIIHFLTFTKTVSGSVSLTLPSGAIYSYDKRLWKEIRRKETLYLGNGDVVYVCGDRIPFGPSNHFETNGEGTVTCTGNVMSLYDAWREVYVIPNGYSFQYAFYNCTCLTSTPDLPATTLSRECYYYMFSGCTGLSVARYLAATNLAYGCYRSMFKGCTNISSVEEEELPATVLAPQCYYEMFSGCTSLESAPKLPATELISQCYVRMFYNCSSLNYVEALFLTTPANYYTDDWLSGVASTGTFVKNQNATWDVRGDNAVPDDWTIDD